jgi:hypothetical protein
LLSYGVDRDLWRWMIRLWAPSPGPSGGVSATLDEAKAAFRAKWMRTGSGTDRRHPRFFLRPVAERGRAARNKTLISTLWTALHRALGPQPIAAVGPDVPADAAPAPPRIAAMLARPLKDHPVPNQTPAMSLSRQPGLRLGHRSVGRTLPSDF